MKSARRHDQLKWVTEISVTPLLDLVFILLFAFMVAVPLVTRTDELLSQPPADSSASPVPTPRETVTLTVLDAESLVWQGVPTPVSEIESRLAAALRERPALGVILEAPQNLPVSSLLAPMQAMQRAGVQSTAIRLTATP